MALITIQNVSKVFKRHRGPRALLGRGGLLGRFSGRREETFTALNDINLEVEPGEYLGLIGANGSGKSTLLKIIAGVTLPTTGHIEVHGRLASLLELGAGFNGMLTGRENVYLNASMLGVRRRTVNKIFDEIVDFSGIEEFIDDPVGTYSSGMFVRLAFSVAIHTNPDIFLLDEILAVGDEDFQRKCRARTAELKSQGTTLIFVSHDLGIVSSLCDRCYLMTKGSMISRGTPQATIDYYVRQVGQEIGVHTFREGPAEVIFCHGRLSLFRDGREVTSPRGFQFQLQYLNNWYAATNAEWRIEERSENGCRAVGEMRTLPIIHHWDLRLENGRLIWNVTLECTREIALEELEANLFLPTTYSRWTHEGQQGDFPEILPTDLAWVMVLEPGYSGNEASVLPEDDSTLPPLYLKLDVQRSFVVLRIQNTDYAYGSRVLQAWGRFPAAEMPMAPGKYDIMTIDMDMGQSLEKVEDHVHILDTHQSIHTQTCTARLEGGRIRIFSGDQELTALVYLHTSVLIDHLWTDSHHLDCGTPYREGNTIYLTGKSTRYPFVEHFEVEAVGNEIAYRVWLEALEEMTVNDYRASIGLQTDYEGWETDTSSGIFPNSGEEERECCASEEGDSSIFVRATSPSLPSLTLAAELRDVPFRMFVQNTGAKVIDARPVVGDEGVLLSKGRHAIFSGKIIVTARDE